MYNITLRNFWYKGTYKFAGNYLIKMFLHFLHVSLPSLLIYSLALSIFSFIPISFFNKDFFWYNFIVNFFEKGKKNAIVYSSPWWYRLRHWQRFPFLVRDQNQKLYKRASHSPKYFEQQDPEMQDKWWFLL